MISLGFDTLVINNKFINNTDLVDLFEIFTPLGIKNFVFLYEIDLASDNITFHLDKSKEIKKYILNVSPRGTRIKVAQSISFAYGLMQNPYCGRLNVSRKTHATFISIPMFPDVTNNMFATELNQMLYRKNIFPIFNSFESIEKTSPNTFYSKLLQSANAGFVFDINHLFDSNNKNLVKLVCDYSTHILPSISYDIVNYIGIAKQAQYFIGLVGKKDYFRLCSLINKTSRLIGF